MAQFPARIHVLLARAAPVGVIIRRGPAKYVCTMLWDRRRDEFRMGQWLKGRINERRSDLSPDGKYLIYFAMNGKWQSEVKGSWTAISRAPYLKAIALFPKGNCWYGGGLFTGKHTYWLNDGYGQSMLRATSELRHDPDFEPEGAVGGECRSVYYPRLLRDGWQRGEPRPVPYWKPDEVFEKQLPGNWTLRKIAHADIGAPPGKGCYWDEHELVHAEAGIKIKCPDWEWADLDRDRLVWATGGKLWAGRLDKYGLVDEVELLDLNPMAFERIQAPY